METRVLFFRPHTLRQIPKLALTFLLTLGIFNGAASADLSTRAQSAEQDSDLSNSEAFSRQVRRFLDHLTKASEADAIRIFGEHSTTVADQLDLKKLHFTSYREVEALLEVAVAQSLDALTLFTLPLLQDHEGGAIVFHQDLLSRIDEAFDFHGLFMVSAPALEDGAAVKMKFLVIGQGKLITGYDRNAKIKHPDYDFATGKYGYRELFFMDAKKDPNGSPGLMNIKALSKPDGKPEWMKGPLNIDIRSLTLTPSSGGQSQILIQYDHLLGSKKKFIDPIPIEKRQRNEG